MKTLKLFLFFLAVSSFAFSGCEKEALSPNAYENSDLTIDIIDSEIDIIAFPGSTSTNLVQAKKGGKGKGGNGGGGGKPGGGECPPSTFTVVITGDATGSSTVENCTSDTANRIIISSSSGPNDPIAVDLTNLPGDIHDCFTVEGPGSMVINADGTVEYYFRQSKNKYVWKSIGTVNGDFPPVVDDTTTIDLYSHGVGKDGKSDPDCLINNGTSMSAQISITRTS